MYHYVKIIQLAQNIGLDDPHVMEALEIYERFPDMAEAVFCALELRAQELGISLADPPKFRVPSNLPGEGILLGHVLRGQTRVELFRLGPSALSAHVLICGETGTGKSWLMGHIVRELIDSGFPVMLFDPEDEYRRLIRLLPPGDCPVPEPGQLLVPRLRVAFRNLLGPQGTAVPEGRLREPALQGCRRPLQVAWRS
jgi:hypothetical protein